MNGKPFSLSFIIEVKQREMVKEIKRKVKIYEDSMKVSCQEPRPLNLPMENHLSLLRSPQDK